jgi:hypothetical protein
MSLYRINYCSDCGIEDGGHVTGCPQCGRYPNGGNPYIGYIGPMKGQHVVAPRPTPKYTPLGLAKPPEPKPDAYVSPHSLDATGENPHNTWINARESYARGSDTLENMLQYVTETNPPPGAPIPVYKPAAKQEPKGFLAVFGLLFTVVGLTPLLIYIFMALL